MFMNGFTETSNNEELPKGGFSFFSQESWKNFRLGAKYMQYAILDALEGA